MVIRIRNRQRAKRLDLRRVRQDLAAAGSLLRLENGELSILFTGSAGMRSLNAAFRGIRKETDVLSFPQDVPGAGSTAAQVPRILGDIVISVPRTISQAKEYGTSFRDELRRLLIHGIVHLAGYDHEAGTAERVRMERKEREISRALQGMDQKR